MITPIILSGGAGTRLWPYSRNSFPKQFRSLGSGQSLLQDTLCRIKDFDGFVSPLVICNQEHRFLVAEQIRELGVSGSTIVLEPVGRNTAPAVSIAALMVARENPDGVLLVMPSDHAISNNGDFLAAVGAGLPAASDGFLVTFGITPTRADSGFGYILAGSSVDGMEHCFHVERFVEKPSIDIAGELVKSGEYFWNAGLFLFSAATFLEEMQRKEPDILACCEAAIASGFDDLDFFRLDAESFSRSKAISIDHAVLETSDRTVVLPSTFPWCDVGSWDALWALQEKDDKGNAFVGDIIAEGARNSLAWSEDQMIVLVDVDDLIVASTSDALLICGRNSSGKIKPIVERLNKEGRAEADTHKTVYRPWGWYRQVERGEAFQVKRIYVKPGASLSLQRHEKRAEHWVVVQGTAKVTCDGETVILNSNQSTYVPIGGKHRLENPGTEPLVVIEIQTGSYFGEDDIVRFDDIYGRTLDVE